MQQKFFWLGFILLFVCFITNCGTTTSSNQDLPGLKFVASFENGNLYQTNTTSGSQQLYVLQLRGTFQAMGRQYGSLLKSQMSELYDIGVASLETRGMSYEAIRESAEGIFDCQPDFIQEMITAMSDTSDFSLEKQKIIAGMMGILFGCSGIGAWGDYSTDGAVVFGRNWDTGRGAFTALGKYVTAVVYNPSSYNHSLVDINYVGSFGSQTCMNDAGLLIDLQNGQLSDHSYNPTVLPPSTFFFSFLLNNSTLTGLITSFESTETNIGLIINLADSSEAFSFEWATYGYKLRTADAEGILAATNHFVDPRWTGLPTIEPGLSGAYTLERRANLLSLGEANKGLIDAQKMMEILDTTIPNGGATFQDDFVYETFYQIVAVPADRQLWLKSRGYSDWEKIDLRYLFIDR